ncbi:MAG: DUF4153 domain-containing protein [Firmicutes bacterium]|nr:DUF4153 domain-containing protein [Bacillota bacterium]
MKLINSIKSLIAGLYTSIKRFPITIGLTTAVTIMLIIINHNQRNFTNELIDRLTRITMLLALGVPLSLCIKLAFRKHVNLSLLYKASIYFAGIIVLVLYYFFLLPDIKMVSVSRYIAFSIALYLCFIFIPYIYRSKTNGLNATCFELYVINLLSRFFVTVIYSAVLFAGLAAIIFTLDKLFSVPIQERYYYYTWLIIAGVFAPAYFLAGLPSENHEVHPSYAPGASEKNASNYPKPLKILLLYIVMPIIAVYTAILYVYFAKIIIILQWPVGLIAHLVLWYSLISTGVIFLVSPLKDENKWVKSFISWFTKIIIPVIAVMFVSIGIRVTAYGITENRYFVILLGLWVLGMMIYTSFTGARKNIVIPVTLALVAVLSVSGPWSSYSLSKFSQNKRFEGILEKYGMLKDNIIVKPEVEVAERDRIELSQILIYFERSHKLSDIKYLPKDFKIENMEDIFGFPYQYNTYDIQRRKYFFYNVSEWSEPTDIRGYDYMIDSRGLYSETGQFIDKMRIKYDVNSTIFQIFHEDESIYSKALSDFGIQLYHRFGIVEKQMAEKQKISQEDMCFIEETDEVKLKFIFLNVYGEKDLSADKVTINSLEFYLLVKIKEGE